MSYFGFLVRFLFIPIIIFLAIALWDNRNKKQVAQFKNGRAVWMAIGVHVLLAVVYTTPWDNYLVATNVWYYNPKLVTGIVFGYVPIEEYTFFILETILAGLWWWFWARRVSPIPEGEGLGVRENLAPRFVSKLRYAASWLLNPPHSAKEFRPNKKLIYVSICLLVLLWTLFTYLFFFGDEKWTYLSITLFWALPPVLLQLLFGADILWHYRKLVFWAIMVPGMYLSLMDVVALKETTWSISSTQTTGILFFGILPLEEVVFFFITNVLIVFGMTLLLANVSEERVDEIKKQIKVWKERTLRPY